MLTRFANI